MRDVPDKVPVKYGDSEHPKELKQRRKRLYGVLNGKFSHMTGDEISIYRAMSREEIQDLIRICDKKWKKLGKSAGGKLRAYLPKSAK